MAARTSATVSPAKARAPGLLTTCLAKRYVTSTVFLKLFVLTAGLFVVVAGYTQDQIAPMMGLLGTLVGYLLGREGSSSKGSTEAG